MEQIIRRVSNTNYFTPLEPKHTLKPRVQRYSKILLRHPEPICNSTSPVFVKNYKSSTTASSPNPSDKLPKLVNQRRFSQVLTKEIPFPLESPLRSNLPPIQRSAELTYTSVEFESRAYVEINEEDEEDSKTQQKFFMISTLAHKYHFKKRSIQPVLKEKKQEKAMQIGLMKKTKKGEKKFTKKKKKRDVGNEKPGENIDECPLNGWERNTSPDIAD
ncbi:hypothetical protein SteCoe_33774 [Stentor coeruleus]|uniref:Uncharacterized protein n=1 Tax=Stentor coeruleus TaxID=5963 RepID=A0A1R2AW60_9CILI|nr:hypothetical protein SteCoe_33774 [Stentor coeruleus]